MDQYSDPKTLYGEICVRLPILSEIGRTHTTVSRASATTQLIAFMILLEGRKEWTPELYAEMAQLLGSISTVESAEVPVALKVINCSIFFFFYVELILLLISTCSIFNEIE